MELKTRNDFQEILKVNPGLIFIKLGASWCKPCEIIADVVDEVFSKMPENTLTFKIDVDESFDFYAFLKSKKMVQGIPTLLCYHKGNESYIPDDSVAGTDTKQIYDFFRTNLEYL
jgi:thioredoxin 1